MSDRISIPVDGWTLEARKFDGGIEISIVTDDKPPASHYVRLSAIGSAALRDYLSAALTSESTVDRMTVLVERLRNYIPGENQDEVADRIKEAADEIERLHRRVAVGAVGWKT